MTAGSLHSSKACVNYVTEANLVARVAAGAFGFLIFSHAFDGPDLYGASSFFETMFSRPSLQMALNISPPSPSVCFNY
jgi:hypothetical protein